MALAGRALQASPHLPAERPLDPSAVGATRARPGARSDRGKPGGGRVGWGEPPGFAEAALRPRSRRSGSHLRKPDSELCPTAAGLRTQTSGPGPGVSVTPVRTEHIERVGMATPFLPAGATTGDSGGELSSGDDSGDMESPQTPETEASRSLAEQFEKAAAHVQSLIQMASREQLLYLYARYKQVKVGNCNIPKPNFFDFEGKQKWEAWKALDDSSPSQAMQEYIAAVKKLDPGWNPQVSEKKGKEASSGFGGPVVSSLYHEETIREEDKNIFDYCRENNIDRITKAIKSKTVEVNVKDEEGRALLHWACDRGHKELVTVLLQYEADINCQDNEGQTALHYAAACEFLDIVELLLQSGADPTLRDQDGCLPEEVTGCKAVSLMLQRHRASKA